MEQPQKGNYSTPADSRKVDFKSLFSGKCDVTKKLLEASEKNVGVSVSSHHIADESETSSDDGDLYLEVHRDTDDQNLDFHQMIQASAVVRLYIRAKNPDEIDNVPSIEDIFEIKPVSQKVFRSKTMRHLVVPLTEVAKEQESNILYLKVVKNKKSDVVQGMSNLLQQTSTEVQAQVQPVSSKGMPELSQPAMEDEVVELY